MRCPVCKNHQAHTEIQVHTNGFDEDLYQCDVCGSSWSVNHGLVEGGSRGLGARGWLKAGARDRGLEAS